MRRPTPVQTAVCATLFALSLAGATEATEQRRISGPVTHANLSIYFVHGPSAPGRVPLTLDEALARNAVRVIETGNVNQLAIENVGDEAVFVQAGDIVKGGKQDRVLTISLLLQPRSGQIPIASFCVEQGRWSARGQEDPTRFTSAAATMPSRKAKIAMQAPRVDRPIGGNAASGDLGARQREVWQSVSEIQNKLSSNLGAPVASPMSRSSLQLSLENEKLREAKEAYLRALRAGGEAEPDIVGVVVAVNGKIASADVYPSNGLFRKMWPKLLAAGVTEAVGERDGGGAPPPATDAVVAFLHAAEQGKASETDLVASVRRETRTTDQAFFFETKTASAWLHRSYLAK